MEIAYHYLWKHKMMGMPLTTVHGEGISIISSGRYNTDAGPDFSNASLKIGSQHWCGNVEIHVKASDWFRHGHHTDPAYNSIILHLVGVNDTTVSRADGREIPQAEAKLPEGFHMAYNTLQSKLKGIRCHGYMSILPHLQREDWMESLAMERLQAKAQRIIDYYKASNGHWEQALFIALARGLGFGLNGLPFEILAQNTPLSLIYHHADQLMQVEAILFGQAGMLNSSLNIFDEYYQSLCSEYAFLAKKYNLRPIDPSLWKYSRTRPQNFPHRRIAMLAQYLHSGLKLHSSLLESHGQTDALMDFFKVVLHEYWHSHIGFGLPADSSKYPVSLPKGGRTLLLINVAAPFYLAYAAETGQYDLAEYGSDLLRRLPAEKNSLISQWEQLGLKPDSAFRSQALLQLRNEYCERNRCLDCRFGHYQLRSQCRKSTT